MSKPELEVALDVRSWERVVVISNRDSHAAYPDEWVRPAGLDDLLLGLDQDSVLIIDGIDVSRRALSLIGERFPRIMGIMPLNEEHSRAMRRVLASLYPWAEFWSVVSARGRLLVVKGAVGRPYDRDLVVDMRTGVQA